MIRLPWLDKLLLAFKAAALKLALLAGLLSLFGFVGNLGWAFDLCSHFRLPYTILFLVAFIRLGFKKQNKKAFVFFILFLINFATLTPFYFSSIKQADNKAAKYSSDSALIRLIHFNIWGQNPVKNWAVDYVLTERPDVVSMNEVDDDTFRLFHSKQIQTVYPYRVRDGELLLLSKRPFKVLELKTPVNHPVLHVRYASPKSFDLYLTHTMVPVFPHFFQDQNDHLRVLGEEINNNQYPVVLLGDLNTTPWSNSFYQLVSQSKLKDSQKVFGQLQPSWPAFFGLCWLPIDHVLLSKHWLVSNRKTGPFIGSDHLPVEIELTLKPQSKTGK